MDQSPQKTTLTVKQALTRARQLQQAGDLAGATGLVARVLEHAPSYVPALHLKGLLDYAGGDKAGAIEGLKAAAKKAPRDAQLRENLGRMLLATGQVEPAIGCLERALALRPDSPGGRGLLLQALGHLAHSEKRQGDLASALTATERALELAPEDPKSWMLLSELKLLAGDFEAGFEAYEWRWKDPDFTSPPQDLPQPPWQGEPLDGKTILVHPEQGYGDSIQFCRYLPLLKERGARTLMAAGPPLDRLFATLEGLDEMVGLNAELPAYDLHVPILSLPRLCGTTLDSVPAEVPYLRADPAAVGSRRREIVGLPGLRVGLAWAGNAKHSRDAERSIDPAVLAPLLSLPGTSWVNLQWQAEAEALAKLPTGRLHQPAGPLEDFADLAAIVAALDLVVTVDTAVAHLAGALGQTVFLLLGQPPDWRWMLGRTDSPWYPSATLFRQPAPGDWAGLLPSLEAAICARRDGKG